MPQDMIDDKDYCCMVCGGHDFTFLFEGYDRVHGIDGKFNLFQCKGCALVFLYPVPKDLNIYYPENYYAFKAKDDSLARRTIDGFKQIILETYCVSAGKGLKYRLLRKLLYPFYFKNLHYPIKSDKKKTERVLDIGCGTGQMLNGLKKLGWEVYGNDISPSACKVAKDSGLENIKIGFFNDLDYPSDFFDCVCMSDVLEHVEDPFATLSNIATILKDQGEVTIALPNYNSLGRRLFGRHDAIFDLPRHLYMFTPDNLSHLLERAGFNIVDLYTTNTISSLTHNLAYAMGVSLAKVQRFDKLMNLLDMTIECFLPNRKRYGNRLIIKCIKK